ncbi:MAG: hypothetical protein WA667_29305 [Candidatus Nitrosopolaris sp.]
MQSAGAYNNPEEKEVSLSGEKHPYHNLARYCLERLAGLRVVTREIISDAADNHRQYIFSNGRSYNMYNDVIQNEHFTLNLVDLISLLFR